MENYNCLLIGINHYDFLQPLNYAMADAQALQQFIVEDMGCSPSRCLVLTDTSPKVKGKSTYPSHQNILEWLNALPFHHSRDGLFWLFFSGYGGNYRGEDYLMPIDGNPQDIMRTGIRMRSLLDTLQQSVPSKILLILDINRSLIGGNPIGEKTIALARERGINLVLSCQPFEFSHEVAALGHGIFTATFLEALRCHRRQLTLGSLYQYLRDRLPELSEQNWRPIQTPVTITPSLEAAEAPIFPVVQPFRLKWQSFPPASSLGGQSLEETKEAVMAINGTAPTVVTTVKTIVEEKAPALATAFASPNLSQLKPSQELLKKTPWLWWLLLGGTGLFLLSVLIPQILNPGGREKTREQPFSQISPSAPSSPPNPALSPSPPPSPRQPSISQELLETARVELKSHQASDLYRAINQARKVTPDQPFYLEAQADISRWSQVILDIGQGRAKKGDFQGAIAAASLIPPDDHSVYFIAQKSLENWRLKDQQKETNRGLMEKAKSLIRPNQASSYHQAILTLRPITFGSPSYAEAEKLREKWAGKIYLIAQSRAARGEYKQALETISLLPKDSPNYGAAETAIAQWQKRLP
jgi:uncharacterized caspase-like protein